MEKMHDEMTKHMLEHMQMGKESVSQCPMMKGMKWTERKTQGGVVPSAAPGPGGN